jgi:transcriptional regulator with PAS, ATPase and Fis domain
MHKPLIEICELTKTFPSASFDQVLAVDNVSLKINTGESVGLVGESGSGKESFSKIIHSLSKRKHGAFIAVNCGAIPEGTIDSALFSHIFISSTRLY